MIVPGLAIFITVLAFNLLGDGLRDALDPRSRESAAPAESFCRNHRSRGHSSGEDSKERQLRSPAAVALALGATACGGSDSDSKSKGGSSGATDAALTSVVNTSDKKGGTLSLRTVGRAGLPRPRQHVLRLRAELRAPLRPSADHASSRPPAAPG